MFSCIQYTKFRLQILYFYAFYIMILFISSFMFIFYYVLKFNNNMVNLVSINTRQAICPQISRRGNDS